MRPLKPLLTLLLLAYVCVMLYFTHVPRPVPIGPDMGDKTRHFLGFALFGLLLYGTLWTWRPRSPWIAVFVMAVALAYGCVDEWTQPLTGRTADFIDWVADTAGVATAATLMGMVHWLIARWPSGSRGCSAP